jgi:endonuclease G
VPTHFYKIVFGEEEDDNDKIGSQVAVGAFVLPNGYIGDDKDLAEFQVELDIDECASGLEFGQNLKSSQRRRLCEDVRCDVKVKDFKDAIELTELPAKANL